MEDDREEAIMTVITTKNNGCLILESEERLDTTTASGLETVTENGLEGMDKPVLNMKDLAHPSSAGLRVILTARKQINRQRTVTVYNVYGIIMGVFEATGPTDIPTTE